MKFNGLPKISVKVRNLAQVIALWRRRRNRIYFAPSLGGKPLSPEEWETFAALGKSSGVIAYALPRTYPESNAPHVREQLEKAAASCRNFLVGQAGDSLLVKDVLADAEIIGDYSLNVFNRRSFSALKEKGFAGLTYSLEMNKAALAYQSGAGEVVVHGFLPVMVSRHCLIGAVLGKEPEKVPCGYSCRGKEFYLSDRLSAHFPVYGDLYHQMHIYNGRELALITEAEFLRKFASWRIEGQFYESRELKQIISLYREARQGNFGQDALASLLNRLRAEAKNPYTKGHFYRGAL